jgi:hypothetical protein
MVIISFFEFCAILNTQMKKPSSELRDGLVINLPLRAVTSDSQLISEERMNDVQHTSNQEGLKPIAANLRLCLL